MAGDDAISHLSRDGHQVLVLAARPVGGVRRHLYVRRLDDPRREVDVVGREVLDDSDVRDPVREGALTPQEKIEQRRFFKAELAKGTKAPWTWMVNHYPLFSETVDRGDNQQLINEWGPLLQEHDISLAFAGHDHTLQHLQVEGYKPSFIVSGAGGARLYDCRVTERGFVNNQVFGFNHVHATPELLTVQFIDAKGRQLHAFTRDRNGKVEVVTQRAPATAGAAG